MDGKRVNPTPAAQSRARTVLNERRTQWGYLPVYSDNEVKEMLKCRTPREDREVAELRRTPRRHYVKNKRGLATDRQPRR